MNVNPLQLRVMAHNALNTNLSKMRSHTGINGHRAISPSFEEMS